MQQNCKKKKKRNNGGIIFPLFLSHAHNQDTCLITSKQYRKKKKVTQACLAHTHTHTHIERITKNTNVGRNSWKSKFNHWPPFPEINSDKRKILTTRRRDFTRVALEIRHAGKNSFTRLAT